MADTPELPGLGWVPEYPDIRDFTVDHDDVRPELKSLGQKDSVRDMLKKIGAFRKKKSSLPSSVDLTKWCSPVENQLSIGSCTAQAGIGLMEYFETRAFGRHLDASRLFLYKTTRNLLGWKGDTGAYIRTTMAAMRLFGAPPEKYYPYILSDFDKEPSAFCYAFAQNYQGIAFYRLDPANTSKDVLLDRIKTLLAYGVPSMFGFTVYSSISQAKQSGEIPFPTMGEKVLGGHAVDAVGYDDGVKIKNSNIGGIETTGALLVRNSWGTGWGNGGYGWLPYEFVLKGLAIDWWSLLKNEWVDTKQFGLE